MFLPTTSPVKRRSLVHYCGFVCLVAIFISVSGCDRDPEVTKLIHDLHDDEPSDRYKAAKKLETFGVRAAPAVPQLTKCLSDEDEKVRYRAAKALANVGTASKNTSLRLGKAVAKDTSPKVRYYAAKALAAIADQSPDDVTPALDHLISGLSDDDPKVRYYITKALGKVGADAKPALSEIEKLVNDQDESVRGAAESAIRRIKKKSSQT